MRVFKDVWCKAVPWDDGKAIERYQFYFKWLCSPVWGCTKCHHEWQGWEERECDWCHSKGKKL